MKISTLLIISREYPWTWRYNFGRGKQGFERDCGFVQKLIYSDGNCDFKIQAPDLSMLAIEPQTSDEV